MAGSYKPSQQKHKRRVLIFAAVIVIVAFVLTLIYLTMVKKPEEQVTIQLPNITKTNVTICDDDCKLQKAVETRVFEDCEKIRDESKKQSCFAAIGNYSLQSCMAITNYENKKTCIVVHAAREDNITLCINLNGDDRKSCITMIDGCHYKNETEKPLCEALAKSDYSLCQKDQNCLYNYVKQTMDIAACNDLDARYEKNACVSVALKKDECVNLPLADEMDACKLEYATKTNQSDECGYIRKDTIYAIDCYEYFARQSKNPKLCDGVELLKRWDCYRKYAKETGDLNGCIDIDQYAPISKEHCFIDIAKFYGNPQACEYLAFDPGSRPVCFRAGIEDNTYLRHDKCANLTSDEWNIRCYTNAAKLEQNISVCDLQSNPADSKFCRDNYKVNATGG